MSNERDSDVLRHNSTWASNKGRCAKCGSALLVDEQDGLTPRTMRVTVRCDRCDQTMVSDGHSRWPSLSQEQASARRRRSAIQSYNEYWRWWYEKR